MIALELARSQQGFCAPNPSVGAIIVQSGQVIASGCHHGPGTPHAEVEAIRLLDTGRDLSDAQLYVTLEPCCHTGRTPPCTDLIIKSGIGEVIIAHQDPNPLVKGQGMQQLEATGIVCHYCPIPEISTFYRAYDYWWETHLPWVTLKLAISANGKIALASKRPAAITGQACQHLTHQQRREHDILFTTAETVLNDNPQFNVRLPGETITKPIAILDRRLRLTAQEKIFSSAETIILFYSACYENLKKLAQLRGQGVTCIAVTEGAAGLDLAAVLSYLGENGYHQCWVEVGADCFRAFIASQYVNACLLYLSNKYLPDDAYGLNRFAYTDHNWQLAWEQMGDDAVLLFHQDADTTGDFSG
jgi:diaminohydroxyphosphoribosylaminopyrimidine deaminase / 5-amino-6-(5-phosphoribosylamino)uracil reductase